MQAFATASFEVSRHKWPAPLTLLLPFYLKLGLKSTLDILCPPFLRGFKNRLEASPLGYRLARGAFWSLAGSFISRVLGLISGVLVGRLLGKDEYGALGMIQGTIGLFGTLAGFGMGLTANRHVAQFKQSDPARAGRIIGAASALAWATSVLMALVLWGMAPWLAMHRLAAPQLEGVLRLGAILLLLGGVNGAQTGTLSGFESFRAVARINLLSGVLSFPLTLGGAWYWGLVGVIWASVLAQGLTCLLCWQAVRAEARKYQITIRFAPTAEDRRLFRDFSLPAVLTGLVTTPASWWATTLVVNRPGGYGEMGIYSAVFRIKSIPDTLLTMLLAPMIPILGEAFGNRDKDAFQRTMRFSFVLAQLIIIPVALVQLAAPWLTVIPLGGDFVGGSAIIQWLMIHSLVWGVMFPTGALLALGRMWLGLWISLLSAGCMAVGSWWLVPCYGAAGYGAASSLGSLLSSAVCLVCLNADCPGSIGPLLKSLKWPLLAGLAGLLAVICFLASLVGNHAQSLVCGLLAGSGFVVVVVWSNLSTFGMQRIQCPGNR